jgi:hypothetical protein
LPNTTYWLVASSPTTNSGSGFSLSSTASTAEDTGALSGWSIGNTRWFTANGGTTWGTDTALLVQFSVQASAIPEPSSYVLILAVSCLGYVAYRRRSAR